MPWVGMHSVDDDGSLACIAENGVACVRGVLFFFGQSISIDLDRSRASVASLLLPPINQLTLGTDPSRRHTQTGIQPAMKSQTARDRLVLAAAVALGSLSLLGAALTIHHYQERRRLLLSGPRRIPKRPHKVRGEPSN